MSLSNEIERISGLSDQEFSTEMIDSLWDDGDFAVFLEVELVDTTNRLLGTLSGAITSQLAGRVDPPEGWKPRANGMLTRVNHRKGEAKLVIRELNRKESATVESNEVKWSIRLLKLAEMLESLGHREALEGITFEGSNGGLTAAEWLDWRRERDARKAQAA